mmetsp:Transcript_110614/g.309170  ORF Transcript_110614/g.309170 Transcript_110614/m.309170 type:complete len:239 (-) Transcript_110614:126-842(-)
MLGPGEQQDGVHEDHQERQGFLRPVPRRDQAAEAYQHQRRRGRVPGAAPVRLLLPQGAPHHRDGAAPGQPVRVLEVQPRVRRRAVLHVGQVAEDRGAGAHGLGLRPLPAAHPLRPQAGEHPHQILQPLRGQGHRLRVVLLRGRPPLLLRAVQVLPRAGGDAGTRLRPEDRPLVPGLHPRRALDGLRALPERLCAEPAGADHRHSRGLPVPHDDARPLRPAVLHPGRAALPGDRGAGLP